jgi:hypothetical protein
MVVNDELGRMWKWLWSILRYSQHFLGKTEEIHKNLWMQRLEEE